MKNKIFKWLSTLLLSLFVLFLSTNIVLGTSFNIHDIELSPDEIFGAKPIVVDINADGKLSSSRVGNTDNLRASQGNYLKAISEAERILKASADSDKFDLRDMVPKSIPVENQGTSNLCWAFSSTGALQSYFALKDFNSTGKESETYNYSETHMDFATLRDVFEDNKINENGYKAERWAKGNFDRFVAYSSTGLGIAEESERFTFDMEKANLDAVYKETRAATLLDANFYGDVKKDAEDYEMKINERINTIKAAISTYGGVYSSIVTRNITGTIEDMVDSDFYNCATGAIYNPTSVTDKINHAVLIIGWDDNYSKDNFDTKPEKDGAWLIRNSYGKSQLLFNTTKAKELFYLNSDATNDDIIEAMTFKYSFIPSDKITIRDDNVYLEMGNEGYYYVSYEDKDINNNVYVITNAIKGTDYGRSYFRNLGMNAIMFSDNNYLKYANVFSRKNNEEQEIEDELLKKVSFSLFNGGTVKLFVNPNGDNLNDLQQVETTLGKTITLPAGYHTLYLTSPMPLKQEKFAICIEFEASNNERAYVPIEIPFNAPGYVEDYSQLTADAGESFIYTADGFIDVNDGSLKDVAVDAVKQILGKNNEASLDENTIKGLGNFTIKGYTEDTQKIQQIKWIQEPCRKLYLPNSNLDFSNAIIEVTYIDNYTEQIEGEEIANYFNIQGFTSDTAGEKTVILSLNDKSVSFNVEVINDEVSSLEIKTLPNKKEYKLEDDLDLRGGMVSVKYASGKTDTISMESKDIIKEGFDSTKTGNETIALKYGGKETSFTIEITGEEGNNQEKPDELKNSNFDNAYCTRDSLNIEIDKDTKDAFYDITYKINNIIPSNLRNEYTYYWYISDSPDNKDIDYRKMDSSLRKEDDGTYSLKFSLNENDTEYIAKSINNNDSIYIYLKEEVKNGEESAVEEFVFTPSKEITNGYSIYVNGILKYHGTDTDFITTHMIEAVKSSQNEQDIPKDNSNNNNNNNNNNNSNKSGGSFIDGTTAKGTLPQTGLTPTLVIIISSVICSIVVVLIIIEKRRDLK